MLFLDEQSKFARGLLDALRVARTIADLAGEESVNVRALAEALLHRAYETRQTPL